MRLDYCQSCNTKINWVPTAATGKNMPVDIDPVEDGNMIIVDRQVVVLKKGEVPPEGALRYKSHYATCPHAARHRGKPRGS